MPRWKQQLLSVYYRATLPMRRRWNEQAALQGRAPVLVVLYHRVADDAANLWTTSRAAFDEQIAYLQENYEMVSMDETVRRIRQGENSRPCVHVTFDDGYAVNCEHALPLLIKRKIPCTYFTTTQPVLEGTPFGHDTAMGYNFPPNTIDELRAISAAGIEIGAHTRTHADIGQIQTRWKLYDELVASRDDLEDALGEQIRYFAFPFGAHRRLSAAAFHMAKQYGFDAVCSAYGGYNFPGDDAFHIQRIPADEATIRLKNWLSMDPRKLRATRRYYYGPTRNELAGALA